MAPVRNCVSFAFVIVACLASALLGAPLGTAFTYHGRLSQAGQPFNGTANLVFMLYDQANAGNLLGTQSIPGVVVTGGLFTVELNGSEELGPAAFNGERRWLEIRVNGATLTPRQELTATPNALFAARPWEKAGSDLSYSGGNVGIGTSSPLFALDLRASTVYGARFGLQGVGGGSLAIVCNPFDNRVWLEGYNSTDDGSAEEMLVTGFAGGLLPRLTLSAASTVIHGNLEITTQDALTITGYQPFMTLRDSNAGNARVAIQQVNGNAINFFTQSGLNTGIPSARIRDDGLDLVGQNAVVIVGYQPFITLADSNAGYARGRIQAVEGDINFFTESSFATGIPPLKIYNSGRTQVRALQIIGGADLAEPFDVKGDGVEPGMVVVIDPEHPGRLKPCAQAYDRKVAGIVSGAGGVATGLSMGHQGTIADGEHPVALTGRVYCLADATHGPIEPGDLLTTSDRPGHAMKAANHERAQGAILGKAMTPLAEGTGLVLVLVTLQ